MVKSRDGDVATDVPCPSPATWLDIEDKTRSELESELPPGLRALSPKKQVVAIVHLYAQPQKAAEMGPPSPGFVSPVLDAAEAIIGTLPVAAEHGQP